MRVLAHGSGRMKERPILFSGPMVPAIMRAVDPKTNTRRVVRFPKNAVQADRPLALTWQQRMDGYRELGAGGVSAAPYLVGPEFGGQRLYCSVTDDIGIAELRCPYGEPGDRLWVRERWAVGQCADTFKPRELHPGTWTQDNGGLWYEAGSADPTHPISPRGRWRSSRFMPRWASRLTLELTDVRVERLQAISEEDAIAEGFGADYSSLLPQTADGFEKNYDAMTPLGRFQWTWNLLNAHRGHGWKSNPWVWALTFRRLEAGA